MCVSKEIREGGRQLLEKLQKYRPLIAAFNGKGGVFLSILIIAFVPQLAEVFLSAGIYEIFCKETFGVKAKNLEFGLQPYRIPETQTVRSGASSMLLGGLCGSDWFSPSGVLPDALIKSPLCTVPPSTR